MSNQEQIELLRKVLADIDAELVVTDSKQLPDTLLNLLKERQISSAALGGDTLLSELGIADLLLKTGVGLIGPLKGDEPRDAVEEWHMALAGADAGITSAVGIALETGSVLLPPHTPDERAMSLLPPMHLVLLRTDQIFTDIGALLPAWTESGQAVGSAVMVTGPSRTADIEKELVLGVHGPQAVTILLIG